MNSRFTVIEKRCGTSVCVPVGSIQYIEELANGTFDIVWTKMGQTIVDNVDARTGATIVRHVSDWLVGVLEAEKRAEKRAEEERKRAEEEKEREYWRNLPPPSRCKTTGYW